MAGRGSSWRSDVEGDDWVRERTVVMKPTVMTSSINARAISVAGWGAVRARWIKVMQIENARK
jgi:hypothetical protein